MTKTIFITGAGSGIGEATAKYFQEKGWNVVATVRRMEDVSELQGLDNVFVTRLDVTDKESITKAVQAGIEKFGKIDVVLNNAGYGAYGVLESATDATITQQFDVNVIGLLYVTREILPHFRKNKGGILINISSIGGKMAFPFGALYHGTKYAVEGISEALSFEVEQIGGKVKIIEPGAIATNFERNMDFFNDESLVEYQPLIQKLMTTMRAMMEGRASPPRVVAEVIYQAATDGTDQLRYPAGEDAKEYMANRKQADDATFMAGIKQMLGIQT